ncbi:MAG: ATP-grasp domain-containing protein [Elusimicrobiota bacterium]
MKKRRTILITSVGGDIGQSIIKCVRDSMPADRIIGCDIDLFAAGKHFADRFYVCPRAADKSKYKRFILNLVKTAKVDYVLPVSEPEIFFFDSNRDIFKDSKVQILINKHGLVKTFFDKYATAVFLKQNGLPYPKTYLLSKYKNQLKFPMLIKPRWGWGGKGAVHVRNNSELRFHRKKTDNAIVQEILGTPENEYTATVFSDGKKYFSIAFRRQLGYGSLTKVAELINDRDISRISERIAKKAGLFGSVNIQFRKTSKGYVPFEVNPRISSTVYFRHYFGFSDVYWWINSSEKRKISFRLKYRKGVAVRCLNEIFLDLKK